MKTEGEIQSFLFKFTLATHFATFCNSNVDREDLFQHIILAFVVKDHNGICLFNSNPTSLYCFQVGFLTVVLHADREISLYMFIHLYKFYSILKFLCHRNILMLHYSILFLIFDIMVMVFVILLTC